MCITLFNKQHTYIQNRLSEHYQYSRDLQGQSSEAVHLTRGKRPTNDTFLLSNGGHIVGVVASSFGQIEMTNIFSRFPKMKLTMRPSITSCYTDALTFFDENLKFSLVHKTH